MDANRNGVLEPNEVPEERRRMVRYMAERMGVDPEKPISLDQVGERLSGRNREGGEDGDKPNDEPEPLVPGFGEGQTLPPVPAFGERVEYPSLIASGSQSALSKMDPERASRIRGFAESMLRRYDRNGNGVLEKDEWEGMRVAQGADRNNDGKITRQEITERLAEYSGRRSRESDGDSSDSDDSGDSGSGESNGRRSRRFLTVAELLPPGLPDWFARYDVNGDGQVAMAEYATDWSASKARDFDRYDLNHDGLITPRECLDAPSATDALADAGGSSPVAGGRPTGAGEGSSGASEEEGGSTPWWLQ